MHTTTILPTNNQTGDDTLVGFEVSYETDIAHLHYDGDTFAPDHSAALFTITVNRVDEDGDETVTLGTFYGTWAGGGACYLNLFTTGGDDASDLTGNVTGPWVSNVCEVLHIGGEADDQTVGMAHDRLVGWLTDYADAVDGVDWFHDASHYGFPYQLGKLGADHLPGIQGLAGGRGKVCSTRRRGAP